MLHYDRGEALTDGYVFDDARRPQSAHHRLDVAYFEPTTAATREVPAQSFDELFESRLSSAECCCFGQPDVVISEASCGIAK
jgi:hypothetical protein